MRYLGALLLLMLSLIVGCGGSSGGGAALQGGTLSLRIEWPDQTRLVPIAAKSIVISAIVTKGEGDDAVSERVQMKIVPRPLTGNLSTVTMKLPSTKLTIQADACPNEDGSGNVQATAQKEVTIEESKTQPISITMVTRIRQVKMTPNPEGATLLVDSTATYEASAESDGDVLVVTSPTKWTWTSSDPSVLAITQVGAKVTVKGLKVGRVTLTATEEESHRTRSAILEVKAKEEPVSIPEGRYVGLITYDIGTGRREKEALTVFPANEMDYRWVISHELPDPWLAFLHGKDVVKEPDGSISFQAEGNTSDLGVNRGDMVLITGKYSNGELNVKVKFSFADGESRWIGSGILKRQ